MKLICELQEAVNYELLEEENKPKQYFIEGIFMQSERKNKNGRIINIGSLSGEYGGPRTPSYAAAKAGVMSLTHCLARFLGRKKSCYI